MVSRSRWSPLDALMRSIRYTGINMAFPSAISTACCVRRSEHLRAEAKGTQDYFGLNYYSTDSISFNIRKAGNSSLIAAFRRTPT